MSSTAVREPEPELATSPPVRIRYMGNKHGMAQQVADLVDELDPEGPFLDLFCGMCSVGSAVARTGRAVWGNDVQWAASTVARCLLTSRDDPLAAEELEGFLAAAYEENERALRQRFSGALKREARLLVSPDLEAFSAERDSWRHVANSPALAREAARLAIKPEKPYRLATLSFAWGYFGLEQAIQIDSIRYAIDRSCARGALNGDQARWALVALLQAASCVASTPGHFAQYLSANTEGSLRRVVSQRRRNVWEQFISEVRSIRPLGDRAWREQNRVMRRDALHLWRDLRRWGLSKGVIYADPPYSKDHYSRYYHVLDTLVRYDYPAAAGKGRYRPDRFVTPFSVKTRVLHSFDRLAKGVAGTESALILSYPSNGLLTTCDESDIEGILSRHFATVDLAVRQPTVHSTLGARHGSNGNEVDELIYVARPRAES